MKKILLLLITTAGYSQTLLKLKAIEHASGAGYCVITNSLGVQTYTPCSSLSSTVVPTWDDVITAGNGTYGAPLIYDNTMTFLQSVGNNNVDLRYDYIKLQDNPSTPLFEANLTTNSVTVNGNQVATVNQLPVLTASTGITISGTTPNYTISSTSADSYTTAASSSTVDLSAISANYIAITGTTSITSFGTLPSGTKRTIRFDGILTLTSNTLSLVLPGNTNIVTDTNDVAMFISEGSGNWRMTSYLRNDESYINYTPSFTGFSVDPVVVAGEARYKMLSKNTCHVIIWLNSAGTSNSTSMTVTLPFNAAYVGTSGLQESTMMMVNNGVRVSGSVRTRSGGSNILDCYYTTFTASGSKTVRLNFVYQTTN